MRWQMLHTIPQRLTVPISEGDALTIRQHLQRCYTDCAKGRVGIRDGCYQRRLQHLSKPRLAQRCIAKNPRKVRIERPKIQQCLVHVENTDSCHSLFSSFYTSY